MRLKVAGVGQRMPRWVQAAWEEYARRMPPELGLQLHEIPLPRRGKNPDLTRLRRREGEALLAAAGAGCRIVALDEGGQAWSTAQLSDRLGRWMGEGRDCAFLIGGPDGLDPTCLRAAETTWSLGPLTLPHPLVRVLLAEQLYRAWTILVGHPYHRA